MLPSRYRLHSRAEISRTIRVGSRARRGALVVHVQLGAGGEVPARAAFAVSKAVGDSVTRHRVVRRLRALMPPLLDQLPGGTELVVRAMPEAASASSAQLREDLVRALERVTRPSGTHTPSASGAFAASPSPDDQVVQAPPGPDVASAAPVPGGAPRTGLHRLLHAIGWPIRSLLLGAIWVYRHTISPMLPPTCRYYPSCSAYGFEALQVHGAAKGTVLTAWRVLRCNPFTPGGLDPVPPRGAWRPEIDPDGTPRVTGSAAA